MSDNSGFDDVIALAAVCVDDVGRAAMNPRGMSSEDAFVLHLRMQRLYMNLCSVASEHGNVSAQRAMKLIGAQLAELAKPHSEEQS